MIRPAVLVLLVCALVVPAGAAASGYAPEPVPGVTRPAILVGNNWAGTTDIVDPETFERLDRIDVIPDKAEREAAIAFDPVARGFYEAIRQLVGEGNHQYNDDVYSSHDGRTLFVSRPSFADVVAIDLATKQIKWRAPVDGYRSDHMAITDDGSRLYVSASTGNVVHELDTATGARTGGFASGDSPHENVITKDGSTIYHASIGRVYSPADRPQAITSGTKGGEFFQVVDRATGQIRKRIVMSDKMAEAGYHDFSAAVRPMALAPDERTAFFQLSFFHGFVEYDLVNDRVLRIARLPISDEAARLMPEEYLLDSAHHGLAIDEAGEKLCVAGTMSDYGAIVSRRTFAPRVLDVGKKPYWATNSADGRYCYISASQSDHVAVISYETEEIVHRFGVGRHPQRVRNGVVRVEQYPQGGHGEPFDLGVFHERAPVGVKRGTENFGCRAQGADRLRLVRCRVELVRAGSVVAAGERFASDRRDLVVPVRFTARGRRLLRRSGRRGMRVRLTARGVDSVGRTDTFAKRVRVRVGVG